MQLTTETEIGFNTLEINPEGKESIIMIHGMFGNLSQFYLTIAPFLAKEYRIILFDLKSHGKSLKTETGYDLISLADDVNKVASFYHLSSFHLLGFSYGALIALKYSMLYENKVKKLIAVEVPDKPKIDFKERGQYTFDDFWYFVVYLNTNVRENFFKSQRHIKKTYKVYDYIFNETTFSEDMNSEQEFKKKDYQKIKSPILLAYGEDSLCFCEYKRIKDWFTDVDYFIDDGDHGFFMDNPERFSEKILQFLEK